MEGVSTLYNNCLFSRRYGVPRAIFYNLFYRLKFWTDFEIKEDSVGKQPLQLVTGAIQILLYGVVYEAAKEIVEA